MFYPFARSYVKCFLKGHFMDKIDIIVKRFSLKRAEFTAARPTSFFDRTNRRLIENTNKYHMNSCQRGQLFPLTAYQWLI